MSLTQREENKRAAHRLLYAPLQEEPIDLDEIFQVMIDSIHDNYVGVAGRERRFTPTEYRTYILSHHRPPQRAYDALLPDRYERRGARGPRRRGKGAPGGSLYPLDAGGDSRGRPFARGARGLRKKYSGRRS